MDPAVRGPDGSVILSPSTAGHLLHVLRDITRRAAGRGDTLPAGLVDLVRILGPVADLPPAGSAVPRSTRVGGTGDELHDVAAVARLTGASLTSVRRAAGRGTLRGHKVAGAWVFTAAAVDAWTKEYGVGRRLSVIEKVAADEVELREMVAAVDAELDQIEAALVEAEREREVAQAVAAAGDAAGSPLEVWKAAEDADAAARRIADLTASARPLRERRNTALAILEPLDRRRREVADQRVRVDAADAFVGLLPAIDKVIAAYDKGVAVLRGNGMSVNEHTTKALRDLAAHWRADPNPDRAGRDRARFEQTINPAEARTRLARLEEAA